MTEIDVACEPAADGWTCRVTVRDGSSATAHRVAVGRDDVARLAPDAAEPVALVRAAFAYLLEREPKESILPAFELSVIGRYYPGWEADVRRRLG
ncbi:MAG: hypothetical protein MUC54_00925 [Chloroflexi bacterium]|jgi:hypothetical protein|nr:hypothetical protein [Chloroflexota bacterium]